MPDAFDHPVPPAGSDGLQPASEDEGPASVAAAGITGDGQGAEGVASGRIRLPDPLERTVEAWDALEAALRAEWQPKTVEEELLLERLLDLSWRLRGAHVAFDAQQDLDRMAAQRKAIESRYDPFAASQIDPQAMDSVDPQLLDKGLCLVLNLQDELEEGHPEWRRAIELLHPVVGLARLEEVKGTLGPLGAMLFGLTQLAPGSAEYVATKKGCFDLLEKLQVRLKTQLDDALRSNVISDMAKLALTEAPTGNRVAELTRYERQLAADVLEVTEQLRRAIGRRRLRALGERWLATT